MMMNACGMYSFFTSFRLRGEIARRSVSEGGRLRGCLKQSKRPLIRLAASPFAAFSPHPGRRKGVI
jgi:hypothetical protein